MAEGAVTLNGWSLTAEAIQALNQGEEKSWCPPEATAAKECLILSRQKRL